MSAVLSLNNLNLKLGSDTILSSISCEIPQGQISVIIGPSGAGKSSLLKSITKLLPSTGQIHYNNQLLEQMNIQDFRKEVIYVSQVPVVFPGTVAENINFGRSIWGLDDIDAEEQLKLVGLPPELKDRQAKDLSVGQQQRLHLARSLALDPKVLLLDEPASGLDAISKEVFEDLIKRLSRENDDLTIIMITHDLKQAERMAEFAILIDQGRLKLAKPADQFFKQVQNMSEAEMLEELINEEEEA